MRSHRRAHDLRRRLNEGEDGEEYVGARVAIISNLLLLTQSKHYNRDRLLQGEFGAEPGRTRRLLC